jgi:hypothetical protein
MTSGTFGLVLRRRLATIPMVVAGDGAFLDAISGLGLPRVPDDAAFEFVWLAGSVSATTVFASIQLAQG